MNASRRSLPLVVILLVAACTSSTASPPPSPSPQPSPSAPPAGGGGQPGNPGARVLLPPDFPIAFPGQGNAPIDPAPQIVQPRAGLLNIHPVGATKIEALVDGRSVVVRISWWSGVEPCSALAGVDVAKDGTTITLTVNEGAADLDAACIEIAQLKAVIVDLGELETGTWTISAAGGGDAAPITIEVS